MWFLFVCVLLQETVYTLPVDHQPVEDAMNHFITWLSRAEEVASNYQPLKADLNTLREDEIANTVRQKQQFVIILEYKSFCLNVKPRERRFFFVC